MSEEFDVKPVTDFAMSGHTLELRKLNFVLAFQTPVKEECIFSQRGK